MAWDSSSFPWEWDAEAFHLPGHGTGTDLRKPAGNNRPLETDLCVGKNGVHVIKELGPAVPTKGAISLAKHELSQLDWYASPHINGHSNGVNRDVVPTTGTTSSTKHDAPQVDWHANRHSNGTNREGGLGVPIAGTTSSAKQDTLHVDWHCNRHITGVSKAEGSTVCPAPSSTLNELNATWRHVNGFASSDLESTYNVIPSGGIIGHADVSCVTTGVLPIVTTCTGVGNGSFADCVNGSGSCQSSTRKAVQMGRNDLLKKTQYGLAGVFETETQQASLMQHGHQQMTVSKEEMQLCVVKEEKGITSASKDTRTHQMDEQHSSNATGSAGSGDSFTGLHLGKRTYSQDGPKATAASKPAQKPVLASKKARTGVATPRCQVEGCKLDLTSAKDYHRRHKVCEPHSKAGKVVVAGSEQRFCQQCSRFHSLSEFDEAKRSCRRRLAGHNERRRKPQPDPLSLHARLHSTFEDWSFLHQPRFSRMPLLWQDPGDFRTNGMWSRMTAGLYDNQSGCDYALQGPSTDRQSFLKSLSQPSLSYHDKLSLLLLQSPKLVMPTSGAYPRVQHYPVEGLGGFVGDSLTLAPSSTGVGALPGLDTTPVTRGVTRVSDSGRALSLLSLQTRGRSQDSDVLMPDPPGLANIAPFNHELGHHEEVMVPQLLLQGGPQYFDDVSVDKTMVSMSLSNSQQQPQSGSAAHLGSLMTFDRDLDDCSFVHDLNRQAGNHPLFALLPFHQEDGLSQGGRHEGAAG